MSACVKPNHISIPDSAKPQNDVEGPRAHESDCVERYVERYVEGSMEEWAGCYLRMTSADIKPFRMSKLYERERRHGIRYFHPHCSSIPEISTATKVSTDSTTAAKCFR